MTAVPDAAPGSATSPAGSAPASSWFTRVRWPLATVAGAGLGAAALLLHDPHQPGSWGLCPMYATTGLYCPACGGLRGTSALLHGDLAGAWADNLLWVVCVPLLVVAWVAWLVLRWRGRSERDVLARVPRWVARAVPWVVVGAFVLFGVVRNLPGFPLQPS